MKAYQGYASETIKKFKFFERYNIRPYDSINEPLVVFGAYKQEDFRVINFHREKVIVMWCGSDVKNYRKIHNSNVVHVTCIPAIREYFKHMKVECHLLKQVMRENPKPKKLGGKVYAYLNRGKPEYHGSRVVKSLKINYDILVGDHSITQKEWYNGEADKFYSQAFIGLCLSEFAGGGDSIMEMGLRGIPVVTNVLNLPHTIPWKNTCDVEEAINAAAKNIDMVNTELAEKVRGKLAEKPDCFNIELLRNGQG